MNVLKNLKKQNGAATIVEASIVLPIVFIVVCVLLVLGYYQLEIATLQTRTDRVADVASKIISQPGYVYYGNYATNKIDFETMPNIDDAKLKQIYKDLDPYRYWGSGERGITESVKDNLKNAIKAKAYFAPSSSITTLKSIKIQKSGLSNKVTIVVSSKVKLPSFFKLLGLPTEIEKDLSSVAYVSDSSEFLRNTDLIFDLATYLDEKCNISNNINDVINKMKKQFEFIGAK